MLDNKLSYLLEKCYNEATMAKAKSKTTQKKSNKRSSKKSPGKKRMTKAEIERQRAVRKMIVACIKRNQSTA